MKTLSLVIDHIDPKCYARHSGFWMIEPLWFERRLIEIKSGLTPVQARAPKEDDRPAYQMTEDGIAIVEISGPMMKGDSKYGGTNTIRTRQALRDAGRDSAVKGILLNIDSPGGTSAGTAELAREVRTVGQQKPLFAHGEDLVASAAYWVGSQAERLYVSPSTEVGSIGTMAMVEDMSGAAAQKGVKVYVISTGEMKGAFAPGTAISEAQLEYLKQRVSDLNEPFMADVRNARKFTKKEFEPLADGRVTIASKAMSMGLVDGVQTMDDTVMTLRDMIGKRDKMMRRKLKLQEAKMSAAQV